MRSTDLSRLTAAASVLALALAAVGTFGAAQTRRFQIRFPEESGDGFQGNEIALTRESIDRLVIDILNPTAEEIARDRIYPWINGEAASTVGELRRTRRGLALYLDLALKPHIRLEPGTNTVEIVAENERGRRFYQNWIVKLKQRSHHEWFTYEFFNGPDEDNPAFPEVEVMLPMVPPVLEPGMRGRSVTVEARVDGYHPLASLEVDGAAQPGTGAVEAMIRDEVSVSTKSKEVAIEAVDARGNRTRVRIPIIPAKAPSPPRLTGKRYLLAVGVSHHQTDPGNLPMLPRASEDAARLASRMIEQKAFKKESVLVLTDRSATLARVRSALHDFVSLPGPDDLLVIFFSGYGLHGLGSEADRTFLACTDTRADKLDVTALDLAELRRILDDAEAVRAENVFLLFDLHRSSALDNTLAGSNLVNARLLNLYSPEKGRTVLVSFQVGQREPGAETRGEGEARGLFTAALTAGLTGEADWNRDRILTAKELFHFVSTKVRAESDGAQIPEYRIADKEMGLVSVAMR